MKNIMVTLMLLSLFLPVPGGDGFAESDTRTHEEAMAAWQDMRFGMFIHWGPVSLKGTEIGWSRGKQVPIQEYDELYTRFHPMEFDAMEWVRTAKDAGMKYIILTSKHHDGFCLWDTKQTTYSIMNTPLGRDIMKELSRACAQEDIAFGTYHSICDWRHPDYPLGSPGGTTHKPDPDMESYTRFLYHQLREIIEGYGPLVTMWFDGEWEEPWTHQHGEALYHYIRELQPGILINNRVDKGRKGMQGTTVDRDLFKGDYDTPEQRIGRFQTDWPWESCITICRQWAWKPDDQLKSLEQCIHTLVNTAGGGGNLLLNVGPMPDGRIEPRQADRLREVGAWLETNGRAIYGTRGGPFRPGDWGTSTHKGNEIYVHVLNWPTGPLRLPALSQTLVAGRLLSGENVSVTQGTTGIEVVPPPESQRDPLDTVVVLELDEPVRPHTFAPDPERR